VISDFELFDNKSHLIIPPSDYTKYLIRAKRAILLNGSLKGTDRQDPDPLKEP